MVVSSVTPVTGAAASGVSPDACVASNVCEMWPPVSGITASGVAPAATVVVSRVAPVSGGLLLVCH